MEIASIIFWALWRRILGGYGNARRGLFTVPVGIFVAAFPFVMRGDYLLGILVAGAVMAFLLPSHTYEPPSAAFKRYGPYFVGYWPAWNWWDNKWNIQGPELNVPESNKWFIDGFSAVGELVLGGLVGATIYCVYSLSGLCALNLTGGLLDGVRFAIRS